MDHLQAFPLIDPLHLLYPIYFIVLWHSIIFGVPGLFYDPTFPSASIPSTGWVGGSGGVERGGLLPPCVPSQPDPSPSQWGRGTIPIRGVCCPALTPPRWVVGPHLLSRLGGRYRQNTGEILMCIVPCLIIPPLPQLLEGVEWSLPLGTYGTGGGNIVAV